MFINTKKGACKIELEPTSTDTNVIKYNIEVKTGSDNGAGTDAAVSLNMFGTQSIIMEKTLGIFDVLTCNKDMFETGNLDIFEFYDKRDIGKLKRIVIWHNGKGFGAAWQLAWVKIRYCGKTYM